jgi:hypothetical protein
MSFQPSSAAATAAVVTTGRLAAVVALNFLLILSFQGGCPVNAKKYTLKQQEPSTRKVTTTIYETPQDGSVVLITGILELDGHVYVSMNDDVNDDNKFIDGGTSLLQLDYLPNSSRRPKTKSSSSTTSFPSMDLATTTTRTDLWPVPGGIATMLKSEGLAVVRVYDRTTLQPKFQSESLAATNSAFNYCLVAGPKTGVVAVISFRNENDQTTEWKAWNSQGEQVFDFTYEDGRSTLISGCPVISRDESSLYLSTFADKDHLQEEEDSPRHHHQGAILLKKVSLLGSFQPQDFHDPVPADTVVTGPGIHPVDGSIYVLTNQVIDTDDDDDNNDGGGGGGNNKNPQQRQHFLNRYHPDSLERLESTALPDLKGFMAQADVMVVNPVFSPNGSHLYFLGTKAIVGIELNDEDDGRHHHPPRLAFQTPMEQHSPLWLRPLLVPRTQRIMYIKESTPSKVDDEDQEEKSTNPTTKIVFVDAVTGQVHQDETISLDQEDDVVVVGPIVAMHLNEANDRLYLTHGTVNGGSRLLVISLNDDEDDDGSAQAAVVNNTTPVQQHVGRPPKESWAAFVLEMVLYVAILMVCLAYQLFRMYRSKGTTSSIFAGSVGFGSGGAYQRVRASDGGGDGKGMEMTELGNTVDEQEELNAEYGDVKEDDDEAK